MSATAQLKYLRISSRKVRLVADLIRGKRVSEAEALLDFTTKRAARPLKKLLESAIANARHNFGLEPANLFISEILVNEGPTLKRVRPRAFGRFFPVRKRTSHIKLVLEEIEKTGEEMKPRLKKIEKQPIVKEKVGKPSRPKMRPERKKFRPRIRERTRRIFRRKAF